MSAYLICLKAVVERECLRFLGQKGRLVSALVRPLVWLLIFATGFRAVLGQSISAPYESIVPYEVYIVPGLCAMIQLFNGMQSSLSLVYDREMGSMRLLLTSPMPRWWLLVCKLLGGVSISILQVYVFLVFAAIFGVVLPWQGYVALLPALVLSGMMLGALGLALSSFIKQLENFAGVMNFVIFPMFFLSSALYPLSLMAENSTFLSELCAFNPLTHAVELIRFALYLEWNGLAFAVTVGALLGFLGLSVWGYDPARGALKKRGGPSRE